MKTIALTLIAAALLAAEDRPAKNAQPPKPAAPQNASLPAIPAGATQVEPNVYRYQDSAGKVWMYVQTPFGLSKWEDAPRQLQPPADPPTVTDLGDRVRFERKTPFGITQWVRPKAELTEEEKALAANALAPKRAAEKQ